MNLGIRVLRFQWPVLCALALLSCSRQPEVRNLACNPVDGVEQLLGAPGVFIGDMHGSAETPAFLRDLSCHVIRSGKPLVVAMEYDNADQPVLDAFLKTSDEQQADRLLTGTAHWSGNIDGRASSAAREALLAIWRYARDGGEVRLLAYDMRGISSGRERDKASAEYLSRQKTALRADAYWILFGGNVHARKIKGLPSAGYEDHEPLGYHVRSWNLLHLNANYRGGSLWSCMGPDRAQCSVRQIGPACTDCPAHTVIHLGRSGPAGDAYDGYFDVGTLTASPPLFNN